MYIKPRLNARHSKCSINNTNYQHHSFSFIRMKTDCLHYVILFHFFHLVAFESNIFPMCISAPPKFKLPEELLAIAL